MLFYIVSIEFMKKILFITPYLPSLKAGGEKFTYLLLESLSKENYIDLVYFKYRGDAFYSPSNSNISVLKVLDNSLVVKLCHAIQHPLTHPIFTVRFDRKLLSLLRELVFKNNYDLFYIDHTQMFMYGKYFPELRKILMAHDVMAQRYSRRGSWLSRKMILNKEKEFVQMPNSTVFTFSEKDNDIIKSNYGITAYSTNFFLDNMILKSSPQTIKQRIVLMGK